MQEFIIKRKIKLLYTNELLILGLLVFFSSAHSASFDCSDSTSNMEKFICSDAELSQADSKLGNLFFEIRDLLVGEEKKDFVNNQRAWLKGRKCLHGQSLNAHCLKEVYRIRNINLAFLKRNFNKGHETNENGFVLFSYKDKNSRKIFDLVSKSAQSELAHTAYLPVGEGLFIINQENIRGMDKWSFVNIQTGYMTPLVDGFLVLKETYKRDSIINWLLIFSSSAYKEKFYHGYSLIQVFSSGDGGYVAKNTWLSSGNYDESECIAGNGKETSVEKYKVSDINGDKVNDISFEVEVADCKTKRESKLEEIFIIERDNVKKLIP